MKSLFLKYEIIEGYRHAHAYLCARMLYGYTPVYISSLPVKQVKKKSSSQSPMLFPTKSIRVPWRNGSLQAWGRVGARSTWNLL